LWLVVKCLSNSEIAGIPRKVFKYKIEKGPGKTEAFKIYQGYRKEPYGSKLKKDKYYSIDGR